MLRFRLLTPASKIQNCKLLDQRRNVCIPQCFILNSVTNIFFTIYESYKMLEFLTLYAFTQLTYFSILLSALSSRHSLSLFKCVTTRTQLIPTGSKYFLPLQRRAKPDLISMQHPLSFPSCLQSSKLQQKCYSLSSQSHLTS